VSIIIQLVMMMKIVWTAIALSPKVSVSAFFTWSFSVSSVSRASTGSVVQQYHHRPTNAIFLPSTKLLASSFVTDDFDIDTLPTTTTTTTTIPSSRSSCSGANSYEVSSSSMTTTTTSAASAVATATTTTTTTVSSSSSSSTSPAQKISKSYLDDGFVFGLEGSCLDRPKGKVSQLVVEGDSLETTPWQRIIVWGTFLGHCGYFVPTSFLEMLHVNHGNVVWTIGQSILLMVTSWILADFGSGVLHWSVDNYGNGRTPIMGGIIAAFQGHHSARKFLIFLKWCCCLFVFVDVW
jgi:hypothetical protein